jgi:molybdopterin converting factor small subunit
VKLDVKLFARARDLAGTGSIELEVSETADVGEVRRSLVAQVPALSGIAPGLLFAVGSNYADDTMPVGENLEVACFPPVSGG